MTRESTNEEDIVRAFIRWMQGPAYIRFAPMDKRTGRTEAWEPMDRYCKDPPGSEVWVGATDITTDDVVQRFRVWRNRAAGDDMEQAFYRAIKRVHAETVATNATMAASSGGKKSSREKK